VSCASLWGRPSCVPRVSASSAPVVSSIRFCICHENPFDEGNSGPHSRSSWANFSTSFFTPNPENCTVIFASSPSPSRRNTTPSPYFGWRTRCPLRNPFALRWAREYRASAEPPSQARPRVRRKTAQCCPRNQSAGSRTAGVRHPPDWPLGQPDPSRDAPRSDPHPHSCSGARAEIVTAAADQSATAICV
jgi:hypothetical protein